MNDQLFIPKKIKVGFQTRSDTYTGKLAYIIYYDSKGVLRKETSWKSWCDEKIESMEVDNTPHNGFVLNKSVKRDSEWFGSGRNMIRIYDDRNFEFEITTGNLLFNLMTYDCLKRGFEGEFVYAWWGKELILLPTDSDEYRKSVGYSELQGQKVSARGMMLGGIYETKRQEKLIFLGKYDWYDYDSSVYYWKNEKPFRRKRKKFVFVNETGGLVDLLAVTSLSRLISDSPVENYAELLEDFTSKAVSSKIVSLEYGEEAGIELKPCPDNYYRYSTKSPAYYVQEGDEYRKYKIVIEDNYTHHNKTPTVSIYRTGKRFYLKDGELIARISEKTYSQNSYGSYYSSSRVLEEQDEKVKNMSIEDFQNCRFPMLYVTLENGKRGLFTENFK